MPLSGATEARLRGDVPTPALLLDLDAFGGAGEDDDFVSGAAQCAGEALRVGADAAETFLGRIFVRNQSDPHDAVPPTRVGCLSPTL